MLNSGEQFRRPRGVEEREKVGEWKRGSGSFYRRKDGRKWGFNCPNEEGEIAGIVFRQGHVICERRKKR